MPFAFVFECEGAPDFGLLKFERLLGLSEFGRKNAGHDVRYAVDTNRSADDVRIPARYMAVGPEAYAIALEALLAHANAAMGQLFVGVARAALEHAIAYAKERVQGGVPIFEHQSVKSRLFKMFMQFEAARSLARRVALYNASSPPLVQYSIASKVFCTNTAFEVASDAVQIFGGNGLSLEYPIEKLLRDARASMIEDGCNEVLGLLAATKL